MDVITRLFQPVQTSHSSWGEPLLLALLVAFIVGQLNAWFYKWTYRGVSYSRTFTQALVLISVTAALSMSLVTSNVVAAFGLLGGLAIIRFRTIIRDARDTAYVFFSLICGMAAGFGYYGTAVVGATVGNLIAVYLHATGFGARQARESLLRFEIEASALNSAAFEALLSRFCRRYAVVSVDESMMADPSRQATCQCAYRVRLRDPEQGPDLVAALKGTFQIQTVHLLVDQEHEDVV